MVCLAWQMEYFLFRPLIITVQDTIFITKMWSNSWNLLVWHRHSATSNSIFEEKKSWTTSIYSLRFVNLVYQLWNSMFSFFFLIWHAIVLGLVKIHYEPNVWLTMVAAVCASCIFTVCGCEMGWEMSQNTVVIRITISLIVLT